MILLCLCHPSPPRTLSVVLTHSSWQVFNSVSWLNTFFCLISVTEKKLVLLLLHFSKWCTVCAQFLSTIIIWSAKVSLCSPQISAFYTVVKKKFNVFRVCNLQPVLMGYSVSLNMRHQMMQSKNEVMQVANNVQNQNCAIIEGLQNHLTIILSHWVKNPQLVWYLHILWFFVQCIGGNGGGDCAAE